MKSLLCTLAILCSVSALAATEAQTDNAINALESGKSDAIETAVTTIYKTVDTMNDKASKEAIKFNLNYYQSLVGQLKDNAENKRDNTQVIGKINALLTKHEGDTALGIAVGQKLVNYIRNTSYANFSSSNSAKQAAQARVVLKKFDSINASINAIDAKAGN